MKLITDTVHGAIYIKIKKKVPLQLLMRNLELVNSLWPFNVISRIAYNDSAQWAIVTFISAVHRDKVLASHGKSLLAPGLIISIAAKDAVDGNSVENASRKKRIVISELWLISLSSAQTNSQISAAGRLWISFRIVRQYKGSGGSLWRT
jgi:hypothetical protein